MTCNNCKASVEEKLGELEYVTDVKVDLANGEAEVSMTKHIATDNLNNSLPSKYTLSDKSHEKTAPTIDDIDSEDENKWQQLKPLFLILLYISIGSILIHRKDLNGMEIMLDFMGLFYIVFSFFKMLDLKGFPDTFRMYDPLARRVPLYAKVYPFIETVLGLMFLLRYHILVAVVVTIVILGITTVGVVKTLLDKRSIRCACLGTALKLPMTEATFIENAIMMTMAGFLLFSLI